MKSQTVTTRDDLRKAQENGVEEIIIKGELANKLNKAKTIKNLGAAGLGILTVALGISVVSAPVTGGLSLFAAAPIAALTGLEIAAIIAASALGIGLIVAIFKDYEEIEYSNGKMILRKKRKT